MSQLRSIQVLGELDGYYDAVLCDAWGVIHNGLKAKDGAIAALEVVRSKGKPVIILTNAPRTEVQLVEHFGAMGVRAGSYDKIISSGEVGRRFISAGSQKRCLHLGPKIDEALFEGAGVELVGALSDAEFIFNSGLRDNTREAPQDYVQLLSEAQALNLPMICVNPDRAVHIGKDRRACAGALAEIYEGLGGAVSWFGKPYTKIYDYCAEELKKLTRENIAATRILAIGDALSTDIFGASKMGYQTLFVVQGIHAEEFAGAKNDADTLSRLKQLCDSNHVMPDYFMPSLI